MESSTIEFTKMHGLGNDMIMCIGPLELSRSAIAALCDRNRGVGGDALIVVTNGDQGVRMRYWNADGSDAEMCGNGLRCVARLAVESKMVAAGDFVVQTDAGPLQVAWDGEEITTIEAQIGKVALASEPVKILDQTFYEANAGNPHAVTLVPSVADAPVKTLGPQIENDPHFPNRTNVEFVELVDDHTIKIRIWERGSGETLACGTGMISAAAVVESLGKAHYPITVEVPGGSAKVWVDDAGYSWMKGPGMVSFKGTVNVADLLDASESTL